MEGDCKVRPGALEETKEGPEDSIVQPATHPWNTNCFFALPFDCIARMSLEKFKKFIAARLGADPSSLEFYSLGNLLEGEDIPLWRRPLAYIVPGALLQMRRRRIVPDEQ